MKRYFVMKGGSDCMNQSIKCMLFGVFLLQLGHLCLEFTNSALVPAGYAFVISSLIIVLLGLFWRDDSK